MTANVNPETNIPYGIIKLHAIYPDMQHDLLYQHGKDLTYEAALKECLEVEFKKFTDAQDELAITRAETGEDRDNPNVGEDDEEYDEEVIKERFNDQFCCDEPVIEGQHKGVHYRTTWLGGAAMLYIFKSPVLTKCRPCSPCVPNAGDLDSVGDYLAYGVPADWLDTDFVEEQIEAAGFKVVMGPDSKEYWKLEHEEKLNGPFGDKYDAASDCYLRNLQVPQ